jgi:hypothetical protein
MNSCEPEPVATERKPFLCLLKKGRDPARRAPAFLRWRGVCTERRAAMMLFL